MARCSIRLAAALALLLGPIAVAQADATPAPARPAIRLLALGDSFTIGTGSSPEQAFPARLVARWKDAGWPVVLGNLAVNGYTTDALMATELPELPRFAPTVVTLAIGANDLVRGSPLERYRAQLRRIFEALRANGVPSLRVIVLPQPDWSQSPAAAGFGDPVDLAARIRAFNLVLREETHAAGERYIDLSPMMERQARSRMFAPDGLHPSGAAHEEWAAALARALDPARLTTTAAPSK